MILFLNFAPIEFMGGAEKWMNDTAKKVSKYEDTTLVSVHPSIANIYGQLVLKRKYDNRASSMEINNHTTITLYAFIPFTRQWRKTRKKFQQARIIYARYEILELLLILCFGGSSALKKTVAGLHSPFIYRDPISLMDKFHNLIYKSNLNIFILRQMDKVHVLNTRDEKYLTQLSLNNIRYVPNGVEIPKSNVIKKTNTLNVISVGELSIRKGTDRLTEIIKMSPADIKFSVVGDGYLKNDIKKLVHDTPNAKFYGHLTSGDLQSLYPTQDALLFPSRAESMSLVVLEALSYGLTVIDSTNVSLDLGKEIEFSCNSIESYVAVLKKLDKEKKENISRRNIIADYFRKNLSNEVVNQKLYSRVFSINS